MILHAVAKTMSCFLRRYLPTLLPNYHYLQTMKTMQLPLFQRVLAIQPKWHCCFGAIKMARIIIVIAAKQRYFINFLSQQKESTWPPFRSIIQKWYCRSVTSQKTRKQKPKAPFVAIKIRQCAPLLWLISNSIAMWLKASKTTL